MNVPRTRLLLPTLSAQAKKAVRRWPAAADRAYAVLRRRRARQARTFLELGGLFPNSRDEIIRDYDYACERTYRGVAQVTNLEAIVRYVVGSDISGAFVECGTFTGGALGFALRSMLRNGGSERMFWGFDAFEGMPDPTERDGDRGSLWIHGRPLAEVAPERRAGRLRGSNLNRADYDGTLRYLLSSGYPEERIKLVKGWFQDTLPKHRNDVGKIAVLRLDGDLYESTRCCLEQLFDQVVTGGVVIVDDYGSFEGCRIAVDEYLASRDLAPHLVYVDWGIRYFIR